MRLANSLIAIVVTAIGWPSRHKVVSCVQIKSPPGPNKLNEPKPEPKPSGPVLVLVVANFVQLAAGTPTYACLSGYVDLARPGFASGSARISANANTNATAIATATATTSALVYFFSQSAYLYL